MPPRKSPWFLYALGAFLALAVGAILYPFLTQIAWGAILAIAWQPLYTVLRERFGRPGVAALITVLLVLALVLVPLVWLGATAVGQGADLYRHLEAQSKQEGGWPGFLHHLIEPPLNSVAARLGMPATNLESLILEKIREWSAAAAASVSSLIGNVLSLIGNALFAMILMFFFLKSGERIRDLIYEAVPLQRERIRHLLGVMTASIVANVYGMVAVALTQGALVGVGFALTGVPSPVLWALIGLFAAFIPIVGSSIIWLPAAGYFFLAGSWGKGLFLVLWGVLVVGQVDNIVRPIILKRGAPLPMLAILLALLGGLQVFGFLGVFAGPVIFSLAQAVWRLLQEDRAAIPQAAPVDSA